MLLLAACAPCPAPARETLAPPFRAACVSSPFGPRALVVPTAGHQHPGIDIPAPSGAWVHAAAAGSVLAIRRRGLGGLWIELQHPDGVATLYAHLGSLAPALAEGRGRVAAGEALGRVGRTGMSFGAHLYFAVLLHGRAVDPQPLLGLAACGR
jgi:murein DD-endopeptidase MepM/ murein hydrolase activator NlpD